MKHNPHKKSKYNAENRVRACIKSWKSTKRTLKYLSQMFWLGCRKLYFTNYARLGMKYSSLISGRKTFQCFKWIINACTAKQEGRQMFINLTTAHEAMISYQICLSCHAAYLPSLFSGDIKHSKSTRLNRRAKLPLWNYLVCRYATINMFDISNRAEKKIVICHEEGFWFEL